MHIHTQKSKILRYDEKDLPIMQKYYFLKGGLTTSALTGLLRILI